MHRVAIEGGRGGRPAVTLSGALFDGPVCVRDKPIAKSVSLSASRFANTVEFRNVDFAYDLILDCSRFKSRLDLSGTTVRGTVSARAVHVAGDMMIRHAHFKQDLLLQQAETNRPCGPAPEDERTVTGSQFTANSAIIEGEIYGDYAIFKDKVNMQFLTVGEDMNFRHGARFADTIDLRSSNTGGRIGLSGAHIAGLELSNGSVGDNLKLCEIQSPATAEIRLVHTRVGNDLDLRGVQVEGRVEGRGMSVQGDLIFDSVDNSSNEAPCDDVTSPQHAAQPGPRGRINELYLQDARVALIHDEYVEHERGKPH